MLSEAAPAGEKRGENALDNKRPVYATEEQKQETTQRQALSRTTGGRQRGVTTLGGFVQAGLYLQRTPLADSLQLIALGATYVGPLDTISPQG